MIKYYDPTTGEEVAEADRQEGVEYKEVTTIETTPKYYTVSLKQTEYGDKTADSAKPIYFKWTTDADGNKQFTQEGASADDYNIAYYMQTEYGDPNGTTTLSYGWEKNADTGNLEFKQDPHAPVGQTITYKYTIPDSGSLERIENTEDKSSETITGTFVNKTTGSTSGSQYGGAIYNNGSNAKLGDINADFIGNYALSTDDYAFGGAIYNYYSSATIGNITGDFIGNYASSSDDEAEGDFIGNYASSTSSNAHGGAIYNYVGTIGDITGDFIGNYASGDYWANGGAIYNNSGTIGDITGDFIGNYASSTNRYANGGAIHNNGGTIENITGDFIGNYASGNSYARGGAIYNYYSSATIGNITGDFIGNYASSSDDEAEFYW